MQHVTLKHQTTLSHIQEDDIPALVWDFTQGRLTVLPTFQDNLRVTPSRVKQPKNVVPKRR